MVYLRSLAVSDLQVVRSPQTSPAACSMWRPCPSSTACPTRCDGTLGVTDQRGADGHRGTHSCPFRVSQPLMHQVKEL